MFDLHENLRNLPEKPGVYIMKDKDGVIIYIGKAKVLKNRVRQYFQSSKNHSEHIRIMVSNIAEFEYIITDTELEALVLECNLIKKHKPKYNILLKDDKHYPYIKITMNRQYPKISVVRKIEKDGAKYYGPYTGMKLVRETLETLKEIFMVTTCGKVFPRDIGKGRACLNFHIKQCVAPCQGNVTAEQYKEIFVQICSFLDGKHNDLIKSLTDEMYEASDRLQFEKAAALRNKINSIRKIEQHQKVISSTLSDKDIIAFARSGSDTCAQIFFIRGGKLIGRQHFILDSVSDNQEIVSSFVKQFYNNTEYVPKEVILQQDIDEAHIIQSWLSDKRGSKVYIKTPQRGESKQLVEMVSKNAVDALNQFETALEQDKVFAQNALSELVEFLVLEDMPSRIEAYDISNTGGSDSVASMVVFKDAKSSNKEYRKFKIKTVEGADDYGSMKEVLRRRFSHVQRGDESDGKFSELPQLILVDGGKGQVSAAMDILNEMCINIPVFGMIKDDRHNTRGIATADTVLELPVSSAAFKLVARIQDEAHRVAISYHRLLRSKRSIFSELDNIKGVGKVRRQNIMKHLKSMDNVRKATVEQLSAIPGVDVNTAQNIHDYFR